MKTVFRPVKFWKSAIMTLPDNSFFELMRSVFGTIKTPFNKQKLTGSLESFLLQSDIQRAIAAYIDADDVRIIAAVALLGEPSPGEMERFFSGEFSYSKLHDLIVNLEERFILYRFWYEDSGHLALNPVLKPILEPHAAGVSILFPTISAPHAPHASLAPLAPIAYSGAGETHAPAHQGNGVDDRVLAAIVSFAAEEKILFKAGGGLRRKTAETAQRIFPDINIEPVLGGLYVLGLLYKDTVALHPDTNRIAGFARLDSADRMAYLAAGMYCFAVNVELREDGAPFLYRQRVRMFAALVYRVSDAVETGRLYPPHTIGRIIEIRGRETTGGEKINRAALAAAMTQTGLLTQAADGYVCRGSILPRGTVKPEDTKQKSSAPVIAMDTPFSCVVYPEIGFADAIALGSMLSIKGIDTGQTVRFELTRDSAVRAFAQGISAAAIIELLTRLSGSRIDQNMAWTVNDWEQRYSEVLLYRGLVLRLSEERRYLAKTRPLAGLIKASLAPGIYMLDESAAEEAADALRKAGVDIIARSMRAHTEPAAAETGAGRINFFPAVASAPERARLPAAPTSPPEESLPGASGIKAGFRSILETMPLSREERAELSARIDRRLVLCESQLKDAVVRYEKLEARGLDYAGKALIAKQAMALKLPVELTWQTPSRGGIGNVTGIPAAVEKSGGESILVIKPAGEGADSAAEEIRIPLGKISLIRRIKKSIFEN